MAYTYTHTPALSRVKIGDNVYYMKDGDVRAILDTYGDVVTYNVESTVANDSKIPTGAAVTAAISSAVKDLEGAMHFLGVTTTNPIGEGGTVTIGGKVITEFEAGDVILYGTKEYVYSAGAWVELGDEAIYLTKANAETYYVQKTVTIAGIDLADDITVSELQNALSLKALAYKDSASANYTPAGSVTVDSYTPAGSISATTTAAGSVTGTVTATGTVAGTVVANGSNTVTSSPVGEGQTANYTPAGTVSVNSVTVTTSNSDIYQITGVGTLPSYTGASYVAPSVSEATSSFATAGVLVTVSKAADTDTEADCLVITDASTASALTSTGFDAGSYTAATFSAGTLPTRETVSVAQGIDQASATATFAGTGTIIAAAFSGSSANISATFTGNADGDAISATFSGTQADVNATFSGTAATLTAGFSGTAATITVS